MNEIYSDSGFGTYFALLFLESVLSNLFCLQGTGEKDKNGKP